MSDLYQHFKGDYYLKICEAEHSETGEILVIYKSTKTQKVYARPKEMFYDIVKKEDYEGPRFNERSLQPNERTNLSGGADLTETRSNVSMEA